MTIINQAQSAVRDMIFGNLGRAAEYRPLSGSAIDLQVVFKPLGRQATDYGDGLFASIDVLREDLADYPAKGTIFHIPDESPSTWRVLCREESESEGQTRFTWSVRCVAETGKRLSPGRLERV